MDFSTVSWKPFPSAEDYGPLAYMFKGMADGRTLAELRYEARECPASPVVLMDVEPGTVPMPPTVQGFPGDLFN